MIFGITSTGKWLASPRTSKNNSITFMRYLHSLMKWIYCDLEADLNNVVLMMDNWSIHKTKPIIDYLDGTGWITVYIPAYTPSFSPVELIFHTIKSYLWKQSRDFFINLEGIEGERSIREALSTLSKDQIKKSFVHSFSEIHSSLLSTL